MKNFIRLSFPDLGRDEMREIEKVFASGWVSAGPRVPEFEKMFAACVGTKYAVATTSGTTALMLAVVACGIGPGDEVLVPDFTFPATANAVIAAQATPVLVDIDLATFNIDAGDLERKITPRTTAVIPVHLFGLSCDMDPIMALAKKFRLKIIEDAACSLGATYKGASCGSLGDVGCFSLHARKIITTGEGGMVTTNNSQLVERMRLLRDHGGIRKGDRYIFKETGYNYRMSEVAASIGIAQMRKLAKFIEKRRQLARKLIRRLQHLGNVFLPEEPEGTYHVFQAFVTRVANSLNRDELIKVLAREGVEARIGTYALSLQPYFRKNFKNEGLFNSHRAYHLSLTLPLYPQMSGQDLERIVAALGKAIKLQEK